MGSGCDNCYAKKLLDTRQAANPTSVRFGHPFETVLTHSERLTQPLRWRRPRKIFVNSLSDLFHRDIPDSFITDVFNIMRKAPQHTFQLLTKRAERMERFVRRDVEQHGVMPHLYLGVSIENEAAQWRFPHLLRTPAAVRWISAEPLIGSLATLDLAGADWIIVGGESGPGARPMQREWARDLRDRCSIGGIPFFFKQWGEWAPPEVPAGGVIRWIPNRENFEYHMARVGKARAGRVLDGHTHDEYPLAALQGK